MKKSTIILSALFAGSMMMQSFQCASSEMTTAKVRLQNKDLGGARNFLLKEVAKNPGNAEAWNLLTDIYMSEDKEVNNIDSAIYSYGQFRKVYKGGDSKLDQTIGVNGFNLWIAALNQGYDHYNKAINAQGAEKNTEYNKAIDWFNRSLELKPENYDPYPAMASVYESLGDTTKALATYDKQIAEQKPLLDLLATNGLMVNELRSKVVAKIGNPKNSTPFRNGSDSMNVDFYPSLNGKSNVYLYYTEADKGPGKLVSLRHSLPDSWLPVEKLRPIKFSKEPYTVAAYTYYNRGEADKALAYLDMIATVVPPDEDRMKLQAVLLEQSGKGAEALKKLADLAEQYPDNALYRIQYASQLSSAERYEEAIAQFEKALTVEPGNAIAIFNIAAAYKNRAVGIQSEEKAKLDADKKYKVNEDRYKPLLAKSAEYFEQYRKLPGKDTEFGAIAQLANTYQVLGETPKLRSLIAQIEGLEPMFDKNPDYYQLLAVYYANQKGGEQKAQDFLNKAEELRK